MHVYQFMYIYVYNYFSVAAAPPYSQYKGMAMQD